MKPYTASKTFVSLGALLLALVALSLILIPTARAEWPPEDELIPMADDAVEQVTRGPRAPLAPLATIVVSSTVDELSTNGQCSLREAITNANDDAATYPDCPAGSGADIVSLPAGTYTLVITGTAEDVNATGDLDISSDIIFQGVSSATTIIDANQVDRIFHVTGSSNNINLQDLTLTGGNADFGGAVHTSSALTMTGVVITNNVASQQGGGVYNNFSSLTIIHSLLSNNSANSAGGFLMNLAGANVITNSTISGNHADWAGGVAWLDNGSIHFQNCDINNNSAGTAAGVMMGGDNTAFVVENSTIRDNSAGENGGAIVSPVSLVMTNTIISGNSTGWGYGGAIAYSSSDVIHITDSTISGNSSDGNGGGLSMELGGTGLACDVTLINTTVSNNTAKKHGGGIASSSGSITLLNVTLAGNTADSDGNNDGDGGGIYASGDSVFIITNTLVADNADLTGDAPDCYGTIVSGDYNLLKDTTGCVVSGTVTNNITGTDPLLRPLGDYGGDTQVQPIPDGSPAQDAIPNGVNGCGTTVTTDQRGIARPQNGACEIGAYEAYPGVDLSIAKTVDSLGFPGQALTYMLNFIHQGHYTSATSVVITDVIPAQVSIQAVVSSGVALTQTSLGNLYTWQAASVAPGAGGVITMSGVLTDPLVAGTRITNTATITTAETDTLLRNNSAAVGLTVGSSPNAPTFTSTPVTAATEDVTYTYAISTTDPDAGDTLFITAPVSPTWLTLTDNGDGTAVLSGTPTAPDVGTHAISLRVTDSGGLTDTQDFVITVQDASANQPPSFTSSPVLTATEGALYTYTVTTTDPNVGDVLTLTAPLEDLPGWLRLIDNGDGTGVLSGRPGDDDVGDRGVALHVEDRGGAAATQTFTITVSNVNDAPRFDSNSPTDLVSNISYTYEITSTDADGDVITLTAPTLPGWLSFVDHGSGGGIITGTPTFADLGDHPVVLQLEDVWAATTAQAFTLTVSNDPPYPVRDEYEVDEDSVDNVLDVLDNDNDYPEDLTLTALGTPAHGTNAISGTTVLYSPDADFFGSDSFTYTVSDGNAATTALVQVRVQAVNDQAPQAVDDPVTVYEDAGGHVMYLLNNDTEPEGDPLTLTAVGAAMHGSVSIQHPTTGTVIYTPTANYFGSDTFTYTVSDGLFDDNATVSVTVNAVNDPPVVVGDAFTVTEDSQQNPLAVLLNDSDIDGGTLTLTGVGLPLNGSAIITATDEETTTVRARVLAPMALTVITYTPFVDFAGSDTFTYAVSDGMVTVQGNVTVTVLAGPNDAPEAQDDSFFAGGNSSDNRLDVLANDRDPDGDLLTASVVAQPANGSAAAAPDGSAILYTPDTDFSGADSFVYAADDGIATMTAMVRLQVLEPNHPPTAADDAFAVDADTQGNAFAVLGNDSDPDGDRLLIVAVGAPAQAGAQAEANALYSALLYDPAPGFSGIDSFTYTVSDGEHQATATVNVTVNAATTEADVSLSRGVRPSTLRAGEAQAVTLIYTVTNAGPAVATGLVLDDAWSIAPDAATVISGGSCTGMSDITCALADLPAGASATLVLNVGLTPASTSDVTADATLSTTKTDPNTGDNQATVALTVSGPRSSQTVGALTLTADSFTDQGGGVTRATGDVVIGEHFYLAGASSTLDFDASNILSASGELRMVRGDYALFDGSFTADATTGLGSPGTGADYAPLAHVAGFPVAGNAAIGQLDLLTGAVTGQATLAFSGGDAQGDVPLAFNVTPGPHFGGDANAPFEVLYGDGAVLRLGATEAMLARAGVGYELLAQGVLTYNLTHPFTVTQTFTPGIPGVYEAIPGVAFKLGSDGTVAERGDGLAQVTLMVDHLTSLLQPVTLDNVGLFAPHAALQIHATLGGGALYLDNVGVTQDGLSLVGQTLALPDIVPDGGLFTIRNPVGTVAEAEAGYTLANFKGDLVLDMAQNHQTIEDFNLGPAALQPGGSASRTPSSSSSPDDVNTDMVAYFPFEKMVESNDFANQISEYPDCGLYDYGTGPPLQTGQPGLGKAVYFDGNDYLKTLGYGLDWRCGLDLGTDSGDAWSIAFWFKAAEKAGYTAFVSNQDWESGANSGFTFGTWCSDAEEYLVFDAGDGSASISIRPTINICDGQWHHFAVRVRTYTSGNTRVAVGLFHNGQMVDFTAQDWSAGFATEKQLTVGADAVYNNKLHGWMDELRIYNNYISPSQIAELASWNPNVDLDIANANVSLSGVSLSSDGCINASSLTWHLPDILGGGSRTIYTPDPICSGGVEVDTTGLGDLEFGSGSVKASFKVSSAKIHKSGDELFLTLRGNIGMEVGGQSFNVTGELSMGSNDQVSGNIEAFDFTLVGFTAGVSGATVNNGIFTAKSISLTVGAPFPYDVGASLYGVSFTPPDQTSLTGAEINLPELGFGKFRMSLSGSLNKMPDGTYQIGASGTFPLKDDGSLSIAVVLVSDSLGRQALYGVPLDAVTGEPLTAKDSDLPAVVPLDPTLLENQLIVGGENLQSDELAHLLAPAIPRAPTGIQLESVEVSLEAEIPLGSSGAYLTGASGSISGLSQDSTEIRVTVGLAFGKEIPGLGRIIQATLNAYMGFDVPYFRVTGRSIYDYTRDRTREVYDNAYTNLGLPDHYQVVRPLSIPEPFNYRARQSDYTGKFWMNRQTFGGEPYYAYTTDFSAGKIHHSTDEPHHPHVEVNYNTEPEIHNPWLSGTRPRTFVLPFSSSKPVPVFLTGNNGFVYAETCGEVQNLAYGKHARQSSTFEGTSTADRAVDGNLQSNYSYGSVTSTANDPNEYDWWEVDLGTISEIDRIYIKNRSDCCKERLTRFYVMISPTPFDDDADPGTSSARSEVRYLWYYGGTFLERSWDTFYNDDDEDYHGWAYGRYVRIQLLDKDQYLSLAEVKVEGRPNLAHNKPTRQSSTSVVFSTILEESHYAVDGSLRTSARTTDQCNAWWEVDLGKRYIVDNIYMGTSASMPLHDFYILASANPIPHDDYVEETIFRSGVYHRYWEPALEEWDGFTRWYNSDMDSSGWIAVRYIRIQNDHCGRLGLREIVVYDRNYSRLGNEEFSDPNTRAHYSDECTIPCQSQEFYAGDERLAWVSNIQNYQVGASTQPCVADWYWEERTDEYTVEAWESPWTFALDGVVTLFDRIELGNGSLTMDAQDGLDAYLTVPRLGTFMRDFEAEAHAWEDSRGFNMTGKLGVRIGISLQDIWTGLPDEGIKFDLGAEFGKFDRSSGGNKWGFKIYLSFDIPGFIDWIPGVPDVILISAFAGYGDGGFDFAWGSDTSSYQLVTRTRVQQAQQARTQIAARQATGDVGDRFMPLNVDPALHFPTAQDVVVDVAVGYDTNATALLQTTNDTLTMTITAPDGSVYEGIDGMSGRGLVVNSYSLPRVVAGQSLRAAQGQAGLRAVHAVDGATLLRLDLWADDGGGDVQIFGDLTFTDTTTYAALAPGNYTLTFREAGTTNVVAQTSMALIAGQDVTLLAAGAPGSVYAWAVIDDNTPRGDDDAYTRMIHAAPNAPNLKVSQIFGRDVFVDVGYGMVSDYQGLMPQGYSFEFLDQDTGDWLFDADHVQLEPYSTNTLFVFETSTGDLVAQMVQDAGPVGQIRFVHAASGLGSVDLDVGAETPFSSVSPATVTADWPLAVGVYDVAVMQGVSPLVTATLVMTDGVDYALALVEDGGVPVLHVFTETNATAKLQGDSLLRLAHLAPTAPAVDVTAAYTDTITTTLASTLDYGEVGDYAVADTRAHTVTVNQAGTSNVLLTATDVPLADGATTLYLVDDGGLTLLAGVDTPIEWLRTDILSLEDAMTGTWQITLHNAGVITDDYRFEMQGLMPETALYGVNLITATDQATVTWHVDGFDPKTQVEFRLGQLSYARELTASKEDVITMTQVITLSSGLTETIEIPVTESADPEPSTFRTLTVLTNTVDPGWINGVTQTLNFDYSDLPSGVYQLQVRVNDFVHPILVEIPTTTLVVSHTWPASWAGNPQVAENIYRQATLTWDAFPHVDLNSHILQIESRVDGATRAYTVSAESGAYTVTNLNPGETYTFTVLAFDYETKQYSLGGQVTVASALAEFALTQMTALPALDIGTMTSIVVSVTTGLDPYPATVALLPGGYSGGLGLRVEPDVVTPTTAGVTATVWISASEYMFNGVYTATLLAWGGGAEHALDLSPSVIAPSFDVLLSTLAPTLTPAGTSLTLDAIGYDGHSADIQLDVLGLPLGVQASFDADTLTAGAQTTLHLMSAPQAARGTYTFTLRADDGPQRQTFDVVVTVVEPEYAITPQTTQQTISATQTAEFALDVALLDGWASPVTLRVDPGVAPNGGTVGLRTTGALEHSVTLSSDGTATLSVDTATTTPNGVYLLAVTAESAGETKTVELELIVGEAAEPGAYNIYLPVIMRNVSDQLYAQEMPALPTVLRP
ncbi:MAG: tandem-95 repeat protein [Chloroflexi bacterium]|nr:tandem-95 repeat protein [Chloroflexota bacterium]